MSLTWVNARKLVVVCGMAISLTDSFSNIVHHVDKIDKDAFKLLFWSMYKINLIGESRGDK